MAGPKRFTGVFIAPRARLPRLPGGWSLLIYLAAALLLYGRSIVANPLHLLPEHGQDPAQMGWFLTQTPRALLHGDNPFLTNLIDYPDGVNLTWNTLMPLAGLLSYPLSVTAGPVAAWNLLLFLGPPTTAWTARLWIGRHATHRPAAWLGGLLIGFSPFIAGHSLGHLNFVLLMLVPVMLMLAEDLLWRHPRGQLKTGVLLGLVTAAQAMLSEEVVVIVVVGVAAACLAALLVRPSETWRAVRGAIGGLAVAVCVFLLLCGWQLGVQLFGPQRVPDVSWGHSVAHPVYWIRPTPRIAVHPGALGALPPAVNESEVTSYVGLPVLALAGVAAVMLRRRLSARVAVFALVAGGVFTLASPDLPVLGNVLPLRYSLVTDVALAFLFAVYVDALLGRDNRLRRGAQLGMLAAVLVAVVTILPAAMPPGRSARVPTFFTSRAVEMLPRDVPVLMLPYPTAGNAAPMLWQASAGMQFRMLGGYALHPGLDGRSTDQPHPDAVATAFLAAEQGQQLTAPQTAAARALLRRHHVHTALLDMGAPQAENLRRAVTSTLGFGPTRAVGGVLVWLPPRGPCYLLRGAFRRVRLTWYPWRKRGGRDGKRRHPEDVRGS